MAESARSEVTEILLTAQRDEVDQREYSDRLFEHVYNELHRIAVRMMRRERVDHTLEPTAIVHEAYLRLVDQTCTNWKNRTHFFRTAARAMRRILIDHERHRSAEKRGGGKARFSLAEDLDVGPERGVNILELDGALSKLAGLDERMARVVELRIFAGMTVKEVSFALDVSERTIYEDWRMAKMWLFREMSKGHVS